MHGRGIPTLGGPLDCALRAVPSKSVTHRALVVAALADGVSALVDPLESDDTIVTREGLSALGVRIDARAECWTVHGCGGRIVGGASVELGDSGTSMRLLAAVAALGRDTSCLDGSPRLRERPVRELVAALRELGASVEAGPSPGGLPLRAGGRLPQGGRVRIPGGLSSQFASALLLIGASLARGVETTLDPPRVSSPYVALTAAVLEAFGVKVERPSEGRYRVSAQTPRGREYRIEGDHSAASYFLAAAAVVGGRIRVCGLDPRSAQADARLGRDLRAMGCRVDTGDDWIEVEGDGRIRPFDVDLSDAPDLAPTLAVLALFADGPCSIRGVPHLRHKESDRLAALARNVEALGASPTVVADGVRIDGRGRLAGAPLRTEGDHRVAMAFAVAGLRVDGVVLDDPDCVGKSNPLFWRQLAELGGR